MENADPSPDTIAAIATPPGRGGIGVVRVSGPAAPVIAARVAGALTPIQPPYTCHAVKIVNATNDDVQVNDIDDPTQYLIIGSGFPFDITLAQTLFHGRGQQFSLTSVAGGVVVLVWS